MAETKGNETKAAETKSGAVKPPVLDLKARETAGEQAKAGASATPTPDKPSERPADKPRSTPVAEPARPGFAFGAALAGAALGLAAAYGLAWFGLWPAAPQPAPAADPRLAQFAAAIPELETVTQTTQSELAALNQRIAALETAEPPAPAPTGAPVDLSAIEAEMAALAERVDALPATPAEPVDVSALTAELATLSARLDEVAARVGTAEAGLRDLDTAVSQTTATLAEQPSDIGAVLQLPLILSGLETAFAQGRPFEAELAALRAALPDAGVPTAIANAAATGLTRPDVIARRFDEVLPAMMAGRPADPQAQWQDGALDWFRSMIALRPTGEVEGDTPDAVMSRLEGAVARRDFVAAQDLMQSLPEPMRLAAGDVAPMIAAQAEASGLLDTLRAQALTGEAAQ